MAKTTVHGGPSNAASDLEVVRNFVRDLYQTESVEVLRDLWDALNDKHKSQAITDLVSNRIKDLREGEKRSQTKEAAGTTSSLSPQTQSPTETTTGQTRPSVVPTTDSPSNKDQPEASTAGTTATNGPETATRSTGTDSSVKDLEKS